MTVSDLVRLLETASAADPATRIDYRDDIAAHGPEAIAPMAAWLEQPQLGAFAVRVLDRIASDLDLRWDVLAALKAAHRHELAPAVARDVAEAIASLTRPKVAERPGPYRTIGPGARGRDVGRKPGVNAEERFHNAMLDVYWLAGEATGYWASYFLRAVRKHEGLPAAHELLLKTGTSPGFERLRKEHRLDLAMEAIVLRPEFAALFSDGELDLAERRLRDAGFDGVDDIKKGGN